MEIWSGGGVAYGVIVRVGCYDWMTLSYAKALHLQLFMLSNLSCSVGLQS